MSDTLVWPERLTLRDTKVIADEGQRIFSTATGYGYEKREYVRADIAASAIERLYGVIGAQSRQITVLNKRLRAAKARDSAEEH